MTMKNQEEAENAIKLLNEKMVDNRAIRVNIARPWKAETQVVRRNPGKPIV